MLVLRLALRNATRHARRTALTALTILLGTMLLVVGMSWVRGILGQFESEAARATGHVRVVSQGWLDREPLQPLSENLPDTAPLVAAVTQLPAVRHAYPKLQLGVLASVEGQELGEVFGMVVGAPIAYFDEVLDLRPRVSEGAFFSDDSAVAEGQALIGRSIATEMDVAPGDEAIFLGQTQDGSLSPIKVTVAGVVDTGNGLYDKQVYVPLEKARWMADIPDGAIELLIYGDDHEASVQLRHELESVLASAELVEAVGLLPDQRLVAQAWSEREPWSSSLKLASTIFRVVVGCIVFITALGVLNTMLMSVLERTAEIGVLRAMGMGPAGLVALFVVEAGSIAVVGGALGTAVGSGLALWMARIGVDLGAAASNLPDTMPVNRVLHPQWSLEIAGLAFLLGLAMAVVGSFTPTLRALTIQPVQAMRARR